MLEKLIIEGGRRLNGRVSTSGSKNAVLPILAACLLADGPCELQNVPDLRDVHFMLDILEELGVKTAFENGTVRTEVIDDSRCTAPYDLVSQMRASFCVLGPLVGRRKRAKVSLPGGCVIGVRPIDLHVKGIQALGADVQVVHGYVEAEAPNLKGGTIFLGGAYGSSVTGTANVMMAAVLAPGTTVIEQAACEPEVADLANFLIAMGAKIEGAGTPRMVVHGVEKLSGVTHRIIPDRIEAETFMIASAATGGDVLIDDCRPDHMFAVIEVLREAGCRVDVIDAQTVRVRGPRRVKPVDVTTYIYPGFPTDTQAQLMALMTLADGISVITDNIYPDRFMHVAEYNRLGAKIRKHGNAGIVQGVEFLSGAPVMASDLRASAGLVIAALAATGETEVHRIYHLDRGYDRIEQKLLSLGAAIRRDTYTPHRRKTDATTQATPSTASSRRQSAA